jgi:threonine dehydrogenase-like Zn-dependent dehydrogenase
VKALLFERKVARYAAAAVAGRLSPGGGARFGPLRLADVDPPELPTDEWVRVRPRLAGICGSDLATIDGHSSRYFEPIVSFPFVPGHEVVGDLDDGSRVVLIPVLNCITRGIDPPCIWCARPPSAPDWDDEINLCERTAFGHLEPGLQTGFCESTGGGWSTLFVAHPSQLLPVPEGLTDEEAVLIEPMACAVHAAIQTLYDDDVAVIGAGTLGLLTIAAMRSVYETGEIVAVAKHPHQRKLAKELGANVVCEPEELGRVIRSRTGSWVVDDRLTGGVSQVIDCVGSAASLQQALDVVRPQGWIHAVGMPGVTTLDLTGLWHREIKLEGCYAYTRQDFAAAADLVAKLDLGRLVSATYPLSRYEDAIAHAANAGARGAVKIAFDLRGEKERTRI